MSVIDLFAGPGGWDIAARQLGIEPIGVELDDAACATREAAGLRTIQADVSEIAVKGLPLGHPELLPCEGLIASPPCQPFSMAGDGHGRRALSAYEDAIERWLRGDPPSREELDEACEDERAHLVLEPLRWALALRPTWIACEQVEQVLPLWEAMAGGLRGAGYSTWTGILSSERYGVPQTRRRAILLARRGGVAREPPATHRRYVAPRRSIRQEESLFDPSESERIIVPGEEVLLPWVSMAEALGWDDALEVVMERGAGMAERHGDRPTRGAAEPAPTVTAGDTGPRWRIQEASAPTVTAGGTAGGGGVEIFAGDAARKRVARMRANSRKNATERAVDEPASTIMGGHDYAERRWMAERPSPTIVTTRKSGDGGLVGRQLPPGEGRNKGGRNWTEENPAGRRLFDRQQTEAAGERLRPDDEPAPTMLVGGLAKGKDVWIPPEAASLDRAARREYGVRVTVEEAAILQSFPADYPWRGTRTAVFQQIGNAIPPLLAYAILKEVIS